MSKKKVDNKVCLYCKETFAQRPNRDRHIKRIHPYAEPNFSQVDGIDDESPVLTLDSDMAETMNVSFLSENGSVLEQSMRMVDEETPVFEVLEPDVTSRRGSQESDTILTETTIQNHATFLGDSVTIRVETAHLSESVTCDPVIPIDTYGRVQTPVFPIPVQNDISDNFDDSVNNEDSNNNYGHQFNFL